MLLTALRTLGFKGLCSAQKFADLLALTPADAQGLLRRMEEQGLAEATPRGFRLTPGGRDQLERELDQERERLDPSSVAGAYREFLEINSTFKRIVTDYQLAADDVRARERTLRRLRRLHARAMAVARRAGQAVPRLSGYGARFDRAMTAVEAGDARYWASPLVDSYHSIWFELHEELLRAEGRSRADEAAAGRAD